MQDTILTLGPYVLPFPIALSAILAILYSLANKPDGSSYISDRVKNGIALLAGMGFGLLAMFDKVPDPAVRDVIGWLIFGFIEGAAAVGLYKSVKIMAGR